MNHAVRLYAHIFVISVILYLVSTFSNCQCNRLCLYVFLVLQTSGYLNLLANCIDNFTHGLAVAGSFLVSKKVRCCARVLFSMLTLISEVHKVQLWGKKKPSVIGGAPLRGNSYLNQCDFIRSSSWVAQISSLKSSSSILLISDKRPFSNGFQNFCGFKTIELPSVFSRNCSELL